MQVIKFNVKHLGPSGLSAFEEWKLRTNQPSATWEDFMAVNKGAEGGLAFVTAEVTENMELVFELTDVGDADVELNSDGELIINL